MSKESSTPAPTTHVCGHSLDRKAARRCDACGQQVGSGVGYRSAKKPCLVCSAAKVAKEKAEAVARREKKIADAKTGAYRLPDGARFDVSYDAAAQLWRGQLTIGDKTFTAEHSAVFKLLRALDRLARSDASLDLPSWPVKMVKDGKLPEVGEVV